MSFTRPTVADFKLRFDRDFGYSKDQTDTEFVRDVDIARAITQAALNFNEALFATQAGFSEGFLLLTAHYLCTNILASTQGLGGSAQWLLNSKGIGNVSGGFSIPDRILRSPILSIYSKTLYGMTYLSIIAPLLTGNVGALHRPVSAE